MGAIPKLEDFDDASFDPFAADDVVYGDFTDIYAPLADLQRKAPVVEGCLSDVIGDRNWGSLAKPGQRAFMVLGHDAVMAAALDPATFANGPILGESIGRTFGNTISVMDPPIHGRYRRIFQAAFLPRTIALWGQDIVTPVIESLITKFAARGHADLVEEFTRHYPFQVIYRQLALPEEQTHTFHKLAIALQLFGDGTYLPRALEASRKLGAFYQQMIDYRRRSPGGNDIVSVLLRAEVDGEHLPDEIMISFLRQLINAGGDTTFRETSSLFAGLLTHPDQLDAVRKDRSLVPAAVEEALRWESPSAIIPRETTRDVTLGGVFIPKGSYVDLFFGMASRDERVYADPHQFNVFRPKARHFGFGYGPHVCIGAHLARLEMANALNAVLDRLPNLRLDPDHPPPVVRGRNLRHPRHVHVRFG